MEIDIREYIDPLRKWWWLILLSTVVAGVSSYFATRQQIPVYSSAATLTVGSAIENPNPNSADFYLTQQLARTYVDLANRASVRNATMEALGLTWLPEIFVRNLNNTNFVEIYVSDANPELAQAVAAEMSRQLILRSPTAQEEDQERQAFVNEQLDVYEAAIKETQTEIEQKNEQLAQLISAREIADMQSEIATLKSSLQSLQSNYAALLPSSQRGATNTVRIIEPASLPTTPVEQSSTSTILLSAGIGFVLAASAAYVLEYMDDTITAPEMIARLTSLSTLTGIAKIRSEEDELITVTKPRSPTSEAFRVLRTALQFSDVETPSKVVLVTSSVPAEGKTITSANLAVVMAQAGNKVLLIDTDLRRPSTHKIFGLSNKRGLTSLLLDYSRVNQDSKAFQNSITDAIQVTRVNGLQLLSCGPIPPNPSELLGSAKMQELIAILGDQFDLMILDSSPVLAVTDAVILGAQVDSTLLVVRAGVSKKEHVKQAVKRLHEVNANLVGCVLNALTPQNGGYGSYYYYRDDSYYRYDEQSDSDGGTETPKGKLRKRFWGKQTA